MALGGLFQLFELFSLGFSYIRFFSVSQIIVYGILLYASCSFIFSSYVLSSYLEKMEQQKAKNKILGWRKNGRDILINIGAMFIIVPLLVIGLLVFSDFD